MPKKKIYFMGLLANVNSSILNVDLDHGFKIEAIAKDEGITLISILEGLESLPSLEVYTKLSIDFPYSNFSENKFYFVSNSFDVDVEMDNKGRVINPLSKVSKFDNNSYVYLNLVTRLMRLFKEGNIYMPLNYYYFIDSGIPKPLMRMRRGPTYPLPYLDEQYTLENSEIPDLQRFIQNTKLPFTEPFLQLAFENFELSYQTYNINLSFLSLMISLETLFNPGGQELRYRISRNTAVLLGKGRDNSKMIFAEIKELYDKRSKIVHMGKSNIINKKDLLKLHHYVRESIKEINKIGKNKSELLDILNSCGFGERPWMKQTV